MKHRARIERLIKACLSKTPEQTCPTREQWDALYRDRELFRELRSLLHTQMLEADLEEAIMLDTHGRIVTGRTDVLLATAPSARLVEFLTTGIVT